VLLDSYIKYLMDTRRFNFAIMFFNECILLINLVSTYDQALTNYMLKPFKFLELYEDGITYLASILSNTNKINSNLLCLQADLLCCHNKFDDAMEIAKFVSSLNPEVAENWICLANVYLKKKLYENCLRALNNIYFLKDTNTHETTLKIPEGMIFKESSVTKNKSYNTNIKFTDILIQPKEIDILYGNNQYYMCDNAEVLYDTIYKIMNCSYFRFDKHQKKTYCILLDMIKEINYDAFIDLKRHLFYLSNNFNPPENDGGTFRTEGLQNMNLKISINPLIEIIIDNLIEDLKIFSVVIAQDEVYFNNLFSKEDLTVTESKIYF
jgi:tetratricopeptide (TPR) repeat protein